ncbi:MAG: ion channel [Gammaproteobacteria bacterium]|nr:ion channel [Gammaproteobacteria bacterium]
MTVEWRLIILITIFVLGAVGTATMYDPAVLPDPLIKGIAYLCIGAAGLLITWGCYRYFSDRVQEDWRLGFVRFVVLYFYLIVGFGSAYYLISADFKDTSQKDVALETLRNESTERQKQIPQLQEDAKREYDKWSALQSEKREIGLRIGEIIAAERSQLEPPRSRILQRPIDPLTIDLEPLYREGDRVKDAQKQLDHDLIEKHREYLTAKRLAEKAEVDIRKYSYFNFVYFSTVTIATVGYGDITPKTRLAKMLVTLEILLGGALVLIYLTLVLGRTQRKSDNQTSPDEKR